ncbi:hypothetical protein HNP55_000705 [Paucibacter oligotrophus]|uniref:TspB protein n=1 Tax=Roseateles oligotrophus TaxID=1769250 RepID=A0A840L1T1_9BURK|nr:hypothetical protein [Roseateles oligotrophus]
MKQHERLNNYSGRIGRGLALVCLAGLGLSAQAARVTMSQFPPNPGVLPGGGWIFTPGTTFANPPPPRAWVNGVYGSVPQFVRSDVVSVAGRAGALAVTAKGAISLADGVAAVGRCLAMSTPVCMAAGAMAAVAYSHYRMRPDGKGGIEFDEGMPEAEGFLWCVDGKDRGCGRSPEEVATGRTAEVLQGMQGVSIGSSTCVITGDSAVCKTSYSQTLKDEYPPFQTRTYKYSNGVNLKQKPGKYCPPVIDFGNPAYSNLAPVPGVDGKCPTGRYGAGLTPEEAAAKVMANPPTLPNTGWGQAVSDAIDVGGQSAPAELTVTGPASQTGSPVTTTTTSPTGTKTETVTPQYDYTYNDNRVTYNETTVTVTNNNGDTTTTTTTGKPPSGTQDPKDPCTANPERIGCQQLGAAPDDKVPKLSKTLQFSAESVGLPGGCPPDVSISINGRSQVVSYAPTCAAAQQAAPWVRAGGAVAALLLVLAALREL